MSFAGAALLAGAAAASSGQAIDLPRAEPGTLGLVPARVQRVERLIQEHVDRGELPGAVLLLARRGKVAAFRAFGWADLESRRPMKPDDLFRLASATKIITSVALLTLYEEGKFALRDSLGDYLPELRNLTVQAPDGQIQPSEKLDRLTSVYLAQEGGLERLDRAETSPLRRQPKALSGGGGWDMLGNSGLVATAPDLFRFLQMLLNGGALEGVRVLSRSTVEMMRRNHLAGLAVPERSPGVGFGFGYAVVDDVVKHGEAASPGMMWWAGSTNVHYWLDPREEFIGLYFTQVQPFPYLDLMDVVRRLSLQALE